MDDQPELRIELTKRADGGAIIRCTRRDGTATWQRHEGSHAQFFPFHDLTHFAVETTLGLRRGFYGLIAEGWDITDTTGKGARGKLPKESILVEHVVGIFDRERAGGGRPLDAAEFNAELEQMAANSGLGPAPAFIDAQLDAVRELRERLHDEWARLAPGGTMTLTYTSGLSRPM